MAISGSPERQPFNAVASTCVWHNCSNANDINMYNAINQQTNSCTILRQIHITYFFSKN